LEAADTDEPPQRSNAPTALNTARQNVTLGHLTLFYITPDLRLACRTG
jgi:hypothetical protein